MLTVESAEPIASLYSFMVISGIEQKSSEPMVSSRFPSEGFREPMKNSGVITVGYCLDPVTQFQESSYFVSSSNCVCVVTFVLQSGELTFFYQLQLYLRACIMKANGTYLHVFEGLKDSIDYHWFCFWFVSTVVFSSDIFAKLAPLGKQELSR